MPLPTNVQGENTGSVFMANLRQENTIGSILTKQSTFQLSSKVKEGYDFVNYANKIPRDLINYADRFFGATTDDEFKNIEGIIRQEINDKHFLSSHHEYNIFLKLFDPVSLLSCLFVFWLTKNKEIALILSVVTSILITEIIFANTQLTRLSISYVADIGYFFQALVVYVFIKIRSFKEVTKFPSTPL